MQNSSIQLKDLLKEMNFIVLSSHVKSLINNGDFQIFEQFKIIENALVEIGNTSSENKDFWCAKFGSHYPSFIKNAL